MAGEEGGPLCDTAGRNPLFPRTLIQLCHAEMSAVDSQRAHHASVVDIYT